MSTKIGINRKQSQFNYDGAKTQAEQNVQPKSRRIATQQVPLKRSQNRNAKARLFQKTEFPSISTKASYRQNQFVLNSAIQKLIEQEIKRGKLFVSSNQIKYPVKTFKKLPQKNLTPQQINLQKLNEIEAKKLQTIEILKQIEQQEILLKKKTVSLRYQKQSNQRKSIKKEKSFFSPQERRAVKKMFFRNKMIQNQLKQKTQRIIQEFRRQSQNQRQNHISELQRHKSLSKSRIQQRRKIIQLKKSQEQKEKQRIEKKLQQVKNRKYLYQQMLEKDQKLAMYEMEDFSKKLQQIKNKMKVTIVEQIKQHKKKYSEVLKPKSTDFNKSKFSLDLNSSNMKKIEQNYFTRLTKAERQMKKQQQEMTKSRPFDLKQKVKQFSERCVNQVRPKIKITEQSRFIPIQRNQSMNSLNYFQQIQKGNEYLSIAKKLKKCETIEDERVLNSKQFDKIPNPTAKINYKNYLKDARRISQENPQNAKKKFALYLQKQGSISDYNSLQKAYNLFESLQAKNKTTKNQKLIDAVQNKIQLLKIIL